MRNLTIVFPYYINPGMLRRQYQDFRALPEECRSHLRLIIVDDGSPSDPAFYEDIGMPLDIFRIDVDIPWNQDAARNIGVEQAPEGWILLTDMDHLIPAATIIHVLKVKLKEKYVYTFGRVTAPKMTPYKPHPNSWLMTRKMYNEIGGYDERLAGLYGTDGDFMRRITAKTVRLPVPLARVPREYIPDASTTTYARKKPEDKDEMKRRKEKRERVKDWKPLRLSFPYHRVQQ